MGRLVSFVVKKERRRRRRGPATKRTLTRWTNGGKKMRFSGVKMGLLSPSHPRKWRVEGRSLSKERDVTRVVQSVLRVLASLRTRVCCRLFGGNAKRDALQNVSKNKASNRARGGKVGVGVAKALESIVTKFGGDRSSGLRVNASFPRLCPARARPFRPRLCWLLTICPT